METVRTEWTSEHVAVLRLDNPPVNALGPALRRDLAASLDRLSREPKLRALIVTATGKHFSAGGDLKESPDPRNLVEAHRENEAVNRALEAFPVPTIAAVNGPALGGGFEMILCCDLRICTHQARFAAAAARMGRVALTQRLPRLVGLSAAKELLFTARTIEADEALKLRLVSSVAEAETLLRDANGLAALIAENSPFAVRGIKRAIHEGIDLSLDEGLRVQQRYYEQAVIAPDSLEAVAAFQDKRKPMFRDEETAS